MYAYSREQKVVELGGVKFGGQPGQNPTVLFGTLFYGRLYSELDRKTMDRAKQLVTAQEEACKRTGLPGLVDVYIRNEGRVKTELDFIIDATDKPFSIDISDAQVRLKALEYLGKAGALDRVIYNSVNLGVTDAEVKALGRHTPAAAIVLAFNPKDSSVDGRLDVLQTGAGMVSVGGKCVGLMELAQGAGVDKILLDTGATPFGQQAAETLRAMPVMKSEFGLPVGCALHNTLESWVWMKKNPGRGEIYDYCDSAANALVPMASGDFIMYGPVWSCDKIFPAVAFVDKLVAEGARDYFGVEPSKTHPVNKLE